MIEKIYKNRMGTLSIIARFNGMRKPQDFIFYPIKAGQETRRLLIQSDTRIGHLHTDTGEVWLSKSHQSGAYGHHLHECTHAGTLDAEKLLTIKAAIMCTAHGDAGRKENRIVGTDNAGALEIFN